MKFEPLADWIVLQEKAPEEYKSTSGIVLGNDGLVQVGRGTILAMSPKLTEEFLKNDGVDLKVGDEVIFSKYQAEEVKIKGDDGLWIERCKVCYKFAIQCRFTPN